MRRLMLCAALLAFAGCKHKPEPKKDSGPPPLPKIATIALPPATTPTVAVRIAFRTGSVDDPSGKEGLTRLAAHLMVEGGTKALSAGEVRQRLFPIAADLSVQVDKEQTVFIGVVHRDFQAPLVGLLADVIALPRLDPKEFDRLKADALNDVQHRLRAEDDEELSRQALLNFMFAGHPYASNVGGSVSGLQAITLDDVKAHIAKVFTLDRMTIGLAGSYDPKLVDQLRGAFAKLPAKGAPAIKLPASPTQIRARLVEKDADSTAMFLGYPWTVKRSDPDYLALAVGISALGEHRQTGGRLFTELRGKRGLNYGDYAYIEHFVQDGYGTYAEPNHALSQQYFGLWIRSVDNANRLFALRAAEWEVKRTADRGIAQDELDKTKGFLATYTRLWEQTADRQLGYALDEAFYGNKDFLKSYRAGLDALTLDQVNGALKKYLDVTQLHLAAVTRGVDGFASELTGGKAATVKYASPKMPKEVLADDKEIAVFDLGIKDSDIQKVNATELFEK
jgi:zinc protease